MEDNKRINAGYEIFDAVRIGSVEFVVGQNIYTPAQYVTWEYKAGRGYYFGHYMNDRNTAIMDMYKRAERELDALKACYTKDQNTDDREEP